LAYRSIRGDDGVIIYRLQNIPALSFVTDFGAPRLLDGPPDRSIRRSLSFSKSLPVAAGRDLHERFAYCSFF
jgi:hypothetical protein